MTKTFTLSDGTSIPAIGFGTWQLNGEVCQQSVETALELGYRHIDTADRYQNHREVAAAVKASGVAREELFITTKIWHDQLHKDTVAASVERFLQELETDYIDLLLIHWPNKTIPLEETLRAMEQAKASGHVKTIGVSNFTQAHLQQALALGSPITVNQVEFHPSLNQRELRVFCEEHGIHITAYSPIAQGQDLELEEIITIAAAHDKTPAQVIINWLVSIGIIVIPRSTKRERMADALAAIDFTLTPAEIEAIDAIGGTNRLVNPDFNEFDLT